MKIEVKGIVIKEVELNNGNRLIHILTDQLGVVTAILNNISFRKSNKFSSIHVLAYCKFMLFKRKEYYYVDEFEVLSIFWETKDDLKILAVCQYFCELCLILSPESTVSGEFLKVFLNSVFFISKKIKDLRLIKIIFEMKSLSLCGYMPNLICCYKFKKYDSVVMIFLIDSGKIICDDCWSNSNNEQYIQVNKGMLRALRHIIYSPVEKIFSFELSNDALGILSELSENYTIYHLGTNFKSLEFYKRL